MTIEDAAINRLEALVDEAISADILAIEKEAEGLLDGLLKVGAKP